jgi:hypothetical protein
METDPMIEAEKGKQITCTTPRIAIPMWITPSKDLEAGTAIPSMMMVLEGTGANTPMIERHVPPDHRFFDGCPAASE